VQNEGEGALLDKLNGRLVPFHSLTEILVVIVEIVDRSSEGVIPANAQIVNDVEESPSAAGHVNAQQVKGTHQLQSHPVVQEEFPKAAEIKDLVVEDDGENQEDQETDQKYNEGGDGQCVHGGLELGFEVARTLDQDLSFAESHTVSVLVE
jgi:hypothetical protein